MALSSNTPLACPAGEVAALRYGNTQVALDLLENILERRGEGHVVVDREAESVSLIGFVVGVLSQNHHLHPVEGAGIECGENLAAGRIDRFGGILVTNKRGQLFEVRLVKFGL